MSIFKYITIEFVFAIAISFRELASQMGLCSCFAIAIANTFIFVITIVIIITIII